MDKYNGKYILSHSLLTEFKTCRRKHYWNTIQRLTPKATASPWLIGGAVAKGHEIFYNGGTEDQVVQAALDVFTKELKRRGNELDPAQLQDIEKQKAMVEGMLVGYVRLYKGDLKKWNILEGPEQQFFIPIINPDTGKEHPKFVYGGRIDLPIQPKNEKGAWVMETKTAAAIGPAYYDAVSLDAQITGYILGAKALFHMPVKGVLYNMILKARIRQKKTESFPAFTNRMVDEYVKSVKEDPEKYYMREEFFRDKTEILEFKRDLWQVACDMAQAMKYERYYRNTSQCSSFYGKCRYIPLCSAADPSLVMKFFRKKSKASEELDETEEDVDY